jgi:hypothetical protein
MSAPLLFKCRSDEVSREGSSGIEFSPRTRRSCQRRLYCRATDGARISATERPVFNVQTRGARQNSEPPTRPAAFHAHGFHHR